MSLSRTFAAFVVLVTSVPAVAQDRPTGLVFADEQAYRSIPLAATPLLGEIPQSVDLTSRFPPPGNQGAQGSCVAWSLAYALKSYQEEVERTWGLDSEQHRFSPAYIYNQVKLSNCLGGSTYIDALNLLRREGVVSLRDFPYDEDDCTTQPTVAQRQLARTYAVADWRRVNVQDETEVKTQVAAGFPVLIGMVVDRPFFNLRSETYDSFSGSNLGGHAVVVVGYSDTRGAFKLINSWGPGWGDGGYGWISYRAFRQVAREGYVVQDIVAVSPTPPPPAPRPRPRPQPQPQPVPQAVPAVALGQPTYQHEVQVPVPTGFGTAPGMRILIPGTVSNAAGRTLQIVVKFNYRNGPPLFANPQEQTFRDISGLVAAGTLPQPIGSNSESLSSVSVSIPYYALNFAPTNFQRAYDLSFVAYAYVDNQLLAQSMPVLFGIRW